MAFLCELRLPSLHKQTKLATPLSLIEAIQEAERAEPITVEPHGKRVGHVPETRQRPAGDPSPGQGIPPQFGNEQTSEAPQWRRVMSLETFATYSSQRMPYPTQPQLKLPPVSVFVFRTSGFNFCSVRLGNGAGIYLNCFMDDFLLSAVVNTVSTVLLLHCGILGYWDILGVSRLSNPSFNHVHHHKQPRRDGGVLHGSSKNGHLELFA